MSYHKYKLHELFLFDVWLALMLCISSQPRKFLSPTFYYKNHEEKNSNILVNSNCYLFPKETFTTKT